MPNWIFRLSGFSRLFTWPNFIQLIMLCFYLHYFYIQYRYSPKIICSYWFITIFFYLLKRIGNISNYYVFGSFIFFLSSKKIYVFNCYVIYLFFILKCFKKDFYLQLRFLQFFYLFYALSYSSLYVAQKNYLIFQFHLKIYHNYLNIVQRILSL